MTSDDRRGRKWSVDVAACDANIKNTQQFVCCQSLIWMRRDHLSQSEHSIHHSWPIRTQYCIQSANQSTVFITVDQSEHSIVYSQPIRAQCLVSNIVWCRDSRIIVTSEKTLFRYHDTRVYERHVMDTWQYDEYHWQCFWEEMDIGYDQWQCERWAVHVLVGLVTGVLHCSMVIGHALPYCHQMVNAGSWNTSLQTFHSHFSLILQQIEISLFNVQEL